jgi:hypothetical protein
MMIPSSSQSGCGRRWRSNYAIAVQGARVNVPARVAGTLAVPLFSCPSPRTTFPSENVTVPVAPDGATVAVRTTACPEADGLPLELRVVLVATGHRQSGSPG